MSELVEALFERMREALRARDAEIERMKLLYHRADDEKARLLAAAEKDAKLIGEYEYVLGNIAHDTIPSSLEPDEYALVALR